MSAQRRRAIVVAILALTTLLAAACGTSPGGGGGAGDKITLKIWDFSAEQVDFHKKVTEQFTKEHPNITVEWRTIAQAEYQKTLPLAFQSRQSPDLFYWSDDGTMNMARLKEQGWIQPLAPKDKIPADFESRWPAGSYLEGINKSGGELYGFPFSENLYWGPGYMFMNRDVFAKAGANPDQPPKTWSELEATCAKIKAAGVECIANPTKGTDVGRLWEALAGGTINNEDFDYNSGRFAMDNPKHVQVIEFIQKLKQEGYLAPGNNDKNFSRQQFAAGQAAIYFDGTWMPSVWRSQGFPSEKVAVAGHPNPDGGPTGALTREPDGNKYWLSSQSKNQAAAWELLQWITQPEGFFAQEYHKNGFGTLAFTDNKKMVSDPAVKQAMAIAEQPGYRVEIPIPVLKCPDLAKSKAFVSAIQKRPNWHYEIMTEAIISSKPFAPLAADLVNEKQRILEEGLQKEAASGLKVSMDCYTFPDWTYTANYGLDKYTH